MEVLSYTALLAAVAKCDTVIAYLENNPDTADEK
jgi:hypothetical protein